MISKILTLRFASSDRSMADKKFLSYSEIGRALKLSQSFVRRVCISFEEGKETKVNKDPRSKSKLSPEHIDFLIS
jgi:hypothetical protein